MDYQMMKELSESFGASGYETEIREVIEKYAKGNYEEKYEDALGNIIYKVGNGKIKVLVEAHMDEVALIVKHIDDKGFIHVATLGGLDANTLLNQRYKFETKDKSAIYGVVGSVPVHLQEEESKKNMKIKDLFIDVGAKSKEDVKKMGINIGDVMVYDSKFVLLGKSEHIYSGKALDNRVSCYAALKLMERINKNTKIKEKYTVYFAFTTQEEVGLKGARTAAFGLDVDYALVLDVSPAGDTPGIEEKISDLKLGEGVVIDVVQAEGRGLITRKKDLTKLVELFDKEKIKFQIEIGVGGVSDAAIIYITKSGIPTIGLGIATRYLHTPVETIHEKDLDLLVDASFLLFEKEFFKN